MDAANLLQTRAGQRLGWSSVLCDAKALLLDPDNRTTRAGRDYLWSLVVRAKATLEDQAIDPLPCTVYPVQRVVACLGIVPPVGCHTDDELEAQQQGFNSPDELLAVQDYVRRKKAAGPA